MEKYYLPVMQLYSDRAVSFRNVALQDNNSRNAVTLIIDIARTVFMRFLKRKENMGSANTLKDRTKTKE
jgi:hypothetical protein